MADQQQQSADSAGTMVVQQQQSAGSAGTMAVLQPFSMLSETVRADPEVIKMLQYAYQMANWSHQHLAVQKFMDPTTANTKILSLGGVQVPTCFAGLTLQQLSERLDAQYGDAGRNFCRAFCEVQKVMSGVYWSRLETLFSMSEVVGSGPLSLKEISEVLPVNEVAQAAKSLCAGVDDMLTASQLFMGNINRLQHKSGKAEYLAKKVDEAAEQIQTLEEELRKDKLEVARNRGDIEQNRALERAFSASEGRRQGVLDALQKELSGVKDKLRKAEKQEHDYTFRCYGPFKWVWENDVALAKEKVRRYTEQADQLKNKISVASAATGEIDWAKEKAEVVKQRVVSEEQQESLQNVVKQRQEKIDLGEKAQAIAQAKLELYLKLEGKDSCEQLIDTMAAIKSVGVAAVSSTNTGDVMVSGWVKDLNFMGMSLSWISRKSKSLGEQRELLGKLKDWTQQSDNMLARFMKEAPPIMDLTRIYSFEDARPQSKRRRITTTSAEVSDTELEQMLKELKEPVFPAEVNTAVVQQRVQAIEAGTEAAATELPEEVPSAAGETTEGGHATSDDLTFIDDMAGDFDD